MILSLYQIDAFADQLFEGNPAAVVPLAEWLPDSLLQAIAQENNLAETAYFIPCKDGFHIRWFTPNKEVELCGHATLATAFVLFEELGYVGDCISFQSLSGPLRVKRADEVLVLDFPSQPPQQCEMPQALIDGVGVKPEACYQSEDYLLVFDSEEQVRQIEPDFRLLETLDLRGVIVTAPAKEYDFVVRFFAPKFGIPEDSVTGSAYTQLTPFWAAKLGKEKMRARQISSRGGNVFCELQGDRVAIAGTAVKYMEAKIAVE